MQYSGYTLTPSNKRKSKYNIHDHQKFRPLEADQFSYRTKKIATNPNSPLRPLLLGSNLTTQYLAYQHSDTITGIRSLIHILGGAHPVWSTVSNDLCRFPSKRPQEKVPNYHEL